MSSVRMRRVAANAQATSDGIANRCSTLLRKYVASTALSSLMRTTIAQRRASRAMMHLHRLAVRDDLCAGSSSVTVMRSL